MTRGCRGFGPIAVGLLLFGAAAGADQNRGVSQIEVRMTYTGFMSRYSGGHDSTCPGVYRSGTDVVEGVVRTRGSGDTLDGEEVEYWGALKRRTHLGICDVQMRNGAEDQNDWCAFILSGTKDVEVEIRVGEEGDGTRVLMTPVPGSISVDVTGGCDTAKSDWRADYFKSDEANFYTVPPGRLRVGRYREYKEGMSGSPSAGEWVLEVGPQVVRAEPGGPYTVVRGEPLTLDGSASVGENLTYEWTFAPKDCPADAPGRTGAKLEGPTPKVTLLCSMNVTLTVSDGIKSDRKTVAVTVLPRDWKTPFNHVPEEGSVPPGGGRPVLEGVSRANPATGSVRMVGGQNVCALDPAAADHILHPLPSGDSWEHTGYELRQVAEPGGPFDGYWFVSAYSIRIERQTLINPYLLPSAAGFGDTKSFYAANKEWGTDVDGYLAAIRAHEGTGPGGHSGLMRQAKMRADPALTIEPQVGASGEEALRTRVDDEIRRAEFRICGAAKDPLPEIWRGRLVYLQIDTYQWIKMDAPTIVGGPSYGTPMNCR